MRSDWPNGHDCAVSLTFDVDAESGWLPEAVGQLSLLSEGRFGVTRGVPRILAILDRAGIKATFYTPGDTAERHTETLREVVEAGHEIGHHGYLHLEANAIDAARQREEIERGLEALERTLNVRPRGYRSPSWELTPETFALLLEFEFAYDSSCMGDDRPYIEAYEDLRILELPVHWSLDDWPHLHWRVGRGDAFTAPDDFLATWLLEYDSALADGRHLTLTMHPEVIGRGYRAILLERLIGEMRARGNPWFAPHGDVERWLVG